MPSLRPLVTFFVFIFVACSCPYVATSEGGKDGAVMVVRVMPPDDKLDFRHAYKLKVAKHALEITKKAFGPYRLEIIHNTMNNDRGFLELSSPEGKIDIMFALTTEERESKAIPIRIPIRRGVLNYRLIVASKQKISMLKNIESVADLKPYAIGVGSNWITFGVLDSQNFPVVAGVNRTSLYKMLAKNRFDYMILGVHEVYNEANLRDFEALNLGIVPGVAVHLVMPLYIFVSRRAPIIAQRLNQGLEMMVQNGDLERLSNQEFSHFIERSQLGDRRIISIANPLLPKETPLHRSELWLDIKSDIGKKDND